MVGQHLQVEIQKLVAGGDGLAHLPDGKVLFVPFSLPEERLQVKIAQDKRDYAVGEIEDILEPSPHRVEPACPHYGAQTSNRTEKKGVCYGYGCGGCQLQHVSYEAEIRLKADSLSEILTRQVKVDLRPEAAYPSPQEWGYRTKSEHPVAASGSSHMSEKVSQPLIGYYQRRTHKLVDVCECPILATLCTDDLNRLRRILGESEEPVYDEQTDNGNLRHLVLRRSGEDERLIGLVTRKDKLRGETLTGLLDEFTDLAGIVQDINPEAGNRILGESTEIISGQGHLTEEVCGLKLRVSFESFFQANHAQAERIVGLVRDFLNPGEGNILCDAYAGVGIIGLAMASDVKEVVAIESLPSSVKDGRHNAEINGFDNIRWIEGDAEELLYDIDYDLLVLDPLRKGITDKVICAVVKTKPQKLCYVSCNPSTWARDVRLLIDAGYELKRLIWLDMFPKTAHMELVSLLEIS